MALADMRVSTAQASLACIIGPTHTDIVHPPDLGLSTNGEIHADDCKVLESSAKINWCELAIIEQRASVDSHACRSNFLDLTGGLVTSKSGEGKEA